MSLARATPACSESPSDAARAKYETAKNVFDDLVHAIGDGRAKPRLRLIPTGGGGEMRAVWFDFAKNSVMIEERAYDALAAMGPGTVDALSFVLGHELAHYYKDHRWAGDFGNEVRDLVVGRTLRGLSGSKRKSIEVESQADYFGGFYGNSAGYATLDVAAEALERIYKEYGLDQEGGDHPSLADRRVILERSAEKLARLIPVFDAGNQLLLIGQYEEAGRCFDFVARTFQSREILNNAGVSLALEALLLFEPEKMPFVYPLELDTETRLGGRTKAAIIFGFGERGDERRQRFLQEARRSLELAAGRDPEYATARINLACVADMQGEHEEAELLARKASKIARERGDAVSQASALIARGIARARGDSPDRAAAEADFEQAKDGNLPLALINLTALNTGSRGSAGSGGGGVKGKQRIRRPERVDGLEAREYDDTIDMPDAVIAIPAAGDDGVAITIYSRGGTGSRNLVIDTGYSTVSFRSSLDGPAGETSMGVRAGSTLNQLTAAYGRSSGLLASRRGTFHIYRDSQIVFRTDGADVVEGWMVYSVE